MSTTPPRSRSSACFASARPHCTSVDASRLSELVSSLTSSLVNLLERPPACSAAGSAVNRRASAFKWLRVASPPACGARWRPRRTHGGCLAPLLRGASGRGPSCPVPEGLGEGTGDDGRDFQSPRRPLCHAPPKQVRLRRPPAATAGRRPAKLRHQADTERERCVPNLSTMRRRKLLVRPPVCSAAASAANRAAGQGAPLIPPASPPCFAAPPAAARLVQFPRLRAKELAKTGQSQRRFLRLRLVTDNASTIAPTLTPSETAPDTERALADEAAARAAGFSLKPPVYAIGTAVNATGERNFRQSRREFEALPFATDASGDLAARVEAERRCDTLVDAPSLNMLADGRLASELGSPSSAPPQLCGFDLLPPRDFHPTGPWIPPGITQKVIVADRQISSSPITCAAAGSRRWSPCCGRRWPPCGSGPRTGTVAPDANSPASSDRPAVQRELARHHAGHLVWPHGDSIAGVVLGPSGARLWGRSKPHDTNVTPAGGVS